MRTLLQHRMFQGPKGFLVAFGIITAVMVPIIVLLTAVKAVAGCDPACQKWAFQTEHVTAFNAGGYGHTPAGLYLRGSMERKAKAAYNAMIAAQAKANPDAAALAATAPSADAWWSDWLGQAYNDASCAITWNIASCVKTVQGPAADTFTSIWNDTPVGQVVILCSVPTIVGAAAASPEAPWAGAGYGAGTCFWGWYYGRTH